MLSKEEIFRQLSIFEAHVSHYDTEFRQANRLPKNHDWRPYRWCSRDIVFALLAVRHERFRNCLEVDVCMMANPPQYFPNSGARVAMGFLLSEAYKCGTSMEIVFTKNVETRIENGQERGRVPAYIYDLACDLEIKLSYVGEGHISPREARQFYMQLTGFSKPAQERIMQLSVEGKITPERICYLVMGGIWSVPEAESLILSSDNPESILLSMAEPEDRHLYLNDIISARGAVLGGALDRKIHKKEFVVNGQIMESEDIEVEVEIGFDSESYAKIYYPQEEINIPWIEEKISCLKPGEMMVVVVRARSSMEIRTMISDDVEAVRNTVEKYRKPGSGVMVYILYPRDFDDIPDKVQTEFRQKMADLGVLVMVSPESLAGISAEAVRRIETGRMVRHE